MENSPGKNNKATLIAAALIITGATAIFGTYANYDEMASSGPNSFTSEETNQLTERHKTKLQQTPELYEKNEVEKREINCI
jgi:hypothetical protein